MEEHEDTGEEFVWNPKCLVAGHAGPVLSVDFSTDGKQIVSGSADNRVMICNAETGAEVSKFVGLRRGWRVGGFLRAVPAFLYRERAVLENGRGDCDAFCTRKA